MSWDVSLEDRNAEPWCSYPADCSEPCYPSVEVPRHEDGGTYALGGTTEADLNITYNYGKRFREAWDGVGLQEALDGRTGEETATALRLAVGVLGVERSGDYWADTPGNAGYALQRLAEWAEARPDGVWSVR